jgi:hypothetical protein
MPPARPFSKEKGRVQSLPRNRRAQPPTVHLFPDDQKLFDADLSGFVYPGRVEHQNYVIA